MRFALGRPFSNCATALNLKFGVVGTGPSAFYAVKYLLKEFEQQALQVDMFDRLPTPGGLVRSGVAPDHPEVKLVDQDFARIAAHENVTFFGNVEAGRDISLEELQQHYDGVILAYGAEASRDLGTQGEELRNVHSARDFVSWYNGHPDFENAQFDLSGENAVIIGQGNVALDIARILAAPIEELRKTDISETAVEALSRSKIQKIHVVGRRGPVQAAFTIKEARELTKLPNCHARIDPGEMEQGLSETSLQEIKMQRPLKRKTDLLKTIADGSAGCSPLDSLPENEKAVWLRFFLGPNQILGTEGRVSSVLCNKMTLSGPAGAQKAITQDKTETLPCDILFSSVGYRSLPLPGLPFDSRGHIAQNQNGRVLSDEGLPVPGLYVAGWLKRGPTGIIGSNIGDAKETVEAIKEDVSTGLLTSKRDTACIRSLLTSRGCTIVGDEGWNAIDDHELTRGKEIGKVRAKLTTWDSLLAVGGKKHH